MWAHRCLSLGFGLAIFIASACDSKHETANAPTAPSTPTIPLGTTYTITGHVTETAPTQATPIPHASVSLLNFDGSRPPGTTVTTDDAGGYTLTNVPAGTQTIAADADGYAREVLTLRITGPMAVQLRLDPEGEQTRQVAADCGKTPQVIAFPVHSAGSILVEGTATGYDRSTDYIFVHMSLDNGQNHIADLYRPLFFAGSFLSLTTNAPAAGMYQASIWLDACFPVQLRVTAPK